MEEQQEEKSSQLIIIQSKLQWTIKYFEDNEVKTIEELLEVSSALNEGIQQMLNALCHRIRIFDDQTEKLLYYTAIFFKILQTSKIKSLPQSQLCEITSGTFDAYLDYLSCEDLDSDEQLLRYGICTEFLQHVTSNDIKKVFIKKLLKKIRLATEQIVEVIRGYCQCAEGLQVDIDSPHLLFAPVVLNVFYYCCQLMKAVITSPSEETAPWVEEIFYEKLSSIFTKQSSSFTLHLPNLADILYSVIHAVKPFAKKEKISLPRFLPIDY